MPFKDAFSYHEAVRALVSLDEARAQLETAQGAFEDAAQHEDVTEAAEAVIGAIEDTLCDLEANTERLRGRVTSFDEFDRGTWSDAD